MARIRPTPPLLLQVMAELGSGQLWEGYICAPNPAEKIAGICDGTAITVNAAYDRVDSILHECIHRLKREWTELGVTRATTRLMRQLTDEQIQIIDQEFERRRRRRKRPVKLEYR